MITRFNPQSDLVVIRAELLGPTGTMLVWLAVDTGALWTMIDPVMLALMGYQVNSANPTRQVLGIGEVLELPVVTVDGVTLCGQTCGPLEVTAHMLAPNLGIDGILGLDFLRNYMLTIDFRQGTLTLI